MKVGLGPNMLMGVAHKLTNLILSHNNPCFSCNIAITNFLSQTQVREDFMAS